MKSIINKSSLKFLESYLNNASPTGYEAEGQKIWMNYLNKYVEIWIKKKPEQWIWFHNRWNN